MIQTIIAISAPRGSRTFQRWELLAWSLPLVFFFAAPDYLGLGRQIMIAALFALALDLALGYAGIVSLGHAAFFGLGAYASGLLSVHGWNEPISGLLFAALLCAVAGCATGFLVVRGNDLARLMVTLGVCFLFYEAANKATGITGGADGLSGIKMLPLLGLFKFDIAGRTGYLYCLVVLLVIFLVTRRLIDSPFGLAIRAIKEGPLRMPAIGSHVRGHLLAAFSVSAAIAGVAGALLAQTSQFVGLDALSFQRSADVLIMLIIGGAGRLYGGLLGAIVFVTAHDALSTLNPIYWQLWLGLLLMALVLFARGGLVAAIDSAVRRWSR